MFGLLHGHGHGQKKTGTDIGPAKNAPSSVVEEITPSPELESPNLKHTQSHNSATSAAVAHPSAILSPTPSVRSNLQVTKKSSPQGRTNGFVRASFQRFTNSVVKEQHTITIRECRRKLGAEVGSYAFDTSFAGLVEWIRSERLIRLPHKGGSWDRVLSAALHFADQIHQFSQHIEDFTAASSAASNLVFGHCLLLLELGHENALALEKVFSLFYSFGLELSPLLKRHDVFDSSPVVSESLGRAFADLLNVVTGVAVTFCLAVHGGRHSTRIDIFTSFGSLIDTYRRSVIRCAHAMWNICLLSENMADDHQVEFLQDWLAPQDTVLAFLASNNIHLANRPEQFTCTWFQSHLTAFLKGNNNILMVEGKAGSGKTTLANWVVDRLQRPVGKKSVSSLSFFFNPSVIAQATSLAMVKTLLCQLLSQRIGDFGLFRAIEEAYFESLSIKNVYDQEEKLWHALAKALRSLNEDDNATLAIIVDGIDEIDGHKPAAIRTSKKLYDLAQKIPAVRLVQFLQPFDENPATSVHIRLSPSNMLDDMRTVARQTLSRHGCFWEKDELDQEQTIENLVAAADGSMIWIHLACEFLLLQKTHSAFSQAVQSATSVAKSVGEVLQRLLASMELGADEKNLLTWLVAAERPLAYSEISVLLRVQPERCALTERSVDLHQLINAIAPFVVVGEGFVTLRHDIVKQTLITMSTGSKSPLQLKERHRDLVVRLLIHAKSCLHGNHEPTFELLEAADVKSRFRSDDLLEYTVRYWTTHFRKSSLFKANGNLDLSKEFAAIFPNSVTFALLERSCWNRQAFVVEAFDLHRVGFRVRKAVFGGTNLCVLQSALICAHLCDTVLSRHADAVDWYHRAAKISHAVLGVQAEITIVCCNTLLRISESLISTKRTEIMTYREEVLLILVSAYKHRHGSSSKEVLEIYRRLAALYVSIGEEHKASEMYVVIRQITVVIFGAESEESRRISRHMDVVLKKHKHIEAVDIFEGHFLGGYSEELELSFSIVQVQELVKFAAQLITENKLDKAEELYIELWLKLTEHCCHFNVLEWHEKKIEVMLLYTRFLQARERASEASVILLCIWREYERHEFSMEESMILLLKEVAVCMKTVGLLALALTVFQKCWSWFKSSRKEEHTVFKEIEEHITFTSTEIVKSSTTTSTTTTTTESVIPSESIMREVYESSVSRSETEITSISVELCKSLTSIYIKQERWSEAITCIKNTLKKSWASFFYESIDSITEASSFASESIELVMQMAYCYISQKRFEKAEQIYLRLYRVHRKLCRLDDVLVIKYGEVLLAFYAEHKYFSKSITFYQELLVEYRTFYGTSHVMTIKVLYALGDLCRFHSLTHGYWVEYYLEIVNSLNKGSLICQEMALRALIVVAEHRFEALRFSESMSYFKSVFATFCKHGIEYKYFESHSEVQLLLEHYFRCLEETTVVIHTHIKIVKEIREACIHFYGAASPLTINTTIVLAMQCSRHEKYEFEAISLHEHILEHSTTLSKEAIKRSETSLRTLYVKQITSTSNSTTTLSKETVERATSMMYERYVETRKTYTCTHELTLTHLRELVMLYHTQSKAEYSVKELKAVVIDCIMKVTSARELVDAARFVAELYVYCSLVSQGYELIRELKLQVIYKSTTNTSAWGFNVTSIGRSCFAFIAALEYHIHAEYSLTLAVFMADLVAEYLFYERFVQCIKVNSKLEAVFINGARLRKILVRTGRTEDFKIVEHTAIEYFRSTEVKVIQGISALSVKIFVHVLLEHLSERGQRKGFVALAGYAAVHRLRELLRNHKHEEALDLTTCAYRFLMAHEGLDDPTEITLGFQLSLMMAGRGEYKHKCNDVKVRDAMLQLSRKILGEVFDICKKNEISLARCQLSELNELIMMVGEQRDYIRLQWLLSTLWHSREGQSTWPQETLLNLGYRLVQAEFSAGNTSAAVRLCEDIVYNVRRVHGARHPTTMRFYSLLANLYTSLAMKYQAQATANGADKSRSTELARLYFRKAMDVREEILKLVLDVNHADNSDDDEDDLGSEFGGLSPPGNANPASGQICGFASREDEVQAVRRHLPLLRCSAQRLGGWSKTAADYDRLTAKLWSEFGPELKMKESECLASKWKVDGFGADQVEGNVTDDVFVVPQTWALA